VGVSRINYFMHMHEKRIMKSNKIVKMGDDKKE
jgi:hypothetical protein